jgi:hypothetical protein
MDLTTLNSTHTNIPPEGYDVAAMAARAAAGQPAGWKVVTGFGPKGPLGIEISVDAEGSVTMPDGYQPVIESGRLTGWIEPCHLLDVPSA